MDLQVFLIVLITNAIATCLSSMSGGGEGIISLPIFLWIGIPLPLSIATLKISEAFWTPISAYNYLKGREIDWRFLTLFTLIGLLGAYFGAQTVALVDATLLSKIIGVIILSFVTYTYFKKDLGLRERRVTSRFKKLLSYLAALLMGFYESIFGSGNGIAFATLTFYSRGFDFIDALGYYFAISFFWVSFASVLLISKGYFDFNIMLAATLGAIFGSYLGSRYARYKGNRFIKKAFILIGGLLAIKLLFF